MPGATPISNRNWGKGRLVGLVNNLKKFKNAKYLTSYEKEQIQAALSTLGRLTFAWDERTMIALKEKE